MKSGRYNGYGRCCNIEFGSKTTAMHVQFGCALCATSAWRNLYSSPKLRRQRLHIVGNFLAKGKVVFPAEVEYGELIWLDYCPLRNASVRRRIRPPRLSSMLE